MLLKLTAIVSLFVLAQGAGWTYEGNHGPRYWGDDNPDCNKEKQSPIDVQASMASYRSDLDDFEFSDYDSMTLGLTLKNNGHTVQVDVNGTAMIDGGGLPEPYKLAQFHFHWGSDDTQGSEHLLNGKQYPMEMHLVHYAESRDELGTAVNKPQGLAVLGFFFEVGLHNANFDEIITHLTNVNAANSSTTLMSFKLEDILPRIHPTYYRYSGSLTTPGCFQSVVWTVFEQTIMVSSEQLEAFRGVTNDDGNMEDNYRPIQNLNGRSIFTNDESASILSSATMTTVSGLLVVMATAVSKLFI